jgi:hypothetical protein
MGLSPSGVAGGCLSIDPDIASGLQLKIINATKAANFFALTL